MTHKIKRSVDRFRRGYDYAAGALLRCKEFQEKTIEQLENNESSSSDDFDKGINAAISDWLMRKPTMIKIITKKRADDWYAHIDGTHNWECAPTEEQAIGEVYIRHVRVQGK